MSQIEGRVWTFGDNISTDDIVPGQYLKLTTDEIAKHVMEGVDPEFPSKVRPGDILVARKNFGCGSSRESAPAAIKHAGIRAVIAEFFARIFYRNAINLGLPVIECKEASRIREGDIVVVRLGEGRIVNKSRNEEYRFSPYPKEVMEILEAGGLVEKLRQMAKSRE